MADPQNTTLGTPAPGPIRAIAGLAAAAILFTSSDAGAESVAPPPPTIEDPHGGMRHFYESLRRAARGEPGAVVRVTVISDSINGWDGVTSTLRHRLQKRFGDAGRGWVHIAPGWNYQHQRDVRWTPTKDWRTHVLNRGKAPGHRFGYGGVMAADGSRRSSVTYHTTEDHPAGGKMSRFRLFYQAYPGAGSVKIRVDDREPVVVQTAADAPTDRVYDLTMPDGPHEVEVAVGEQHVRLYGVVMERDGPGVVVDAVALIGARVARLNLFDPAHWQEQIRQRSPDLLVFWLGGNNAHADRFGREAFIEDYGRAIATARRGRPEASCLVASITDIGERGSGETLDFAIPVVEASREVALAQRCGFLNVFEAMGGAGSMRRWHRSSPRLSTPDFRHLTPEGARRMGGIFERALMSGYEAFRRR